MTLIPGRFMTCIPHKIFFRVRKSRRLMARDACGGEKRSIQSSVGNPQGKRPHARHRRRWYFDITILQ
jgi:hypothetical protein